MKLNTLWLESLLYASVAISIVFYKYEIAGFSVATWVAIPAFLFFSLKWLLAAAKTRRSHAFFDLLLIAIFFGLVWFSSAYNPLYAENIVSFLLRYIFFATPLLFVLDRKKFNFAANLISAQTVIVCLALIMGGFGLIEFESVRTESARFDIGVSEGRTTGILGNFADYAMLASFAIFLTGYLVAIGKRSDKSLIVIVVIVVTSEFFAQSRNLIVTFACASLVFAFATSYGSGKLAYKLIVLATVSTAAPILFYLYIQYFETLDYGRILQAKAALELIIDSPLIGHGANSFTVLTYFPWNVHNIILQLLVSGGLLALIPFFLCISLITYRLLRLTSTPKPFLAAIAVSILVSSMFYPALSSIIFWWLLGHLAAATLTLESNSRPTKVESEALTLDPELEKPTTSHPALNRS